MRIAAAPVSWGIFEVTMSADLPSAPAYLDDVVALGYAGTETGPPGYLGEPSEARRLLECRQLDIAGMFLAYDFATPERQDDNLERLGFALQLVKGLMPDGASPVIVFSDDYQRPERMAVAGRVSAHSESSLPGREWPGFVSAVNHLAMVCADLGFVVAFHPHVGSYVETPAEIERLVTGLDESSIGLCLDIGHVTFGGGDALELTKTYAAAIRHIHAKDVNGALLERILAKGGGLWDAWRQSVFCDLGTGSAHVAECLRVLDNAGYEDWVVVEQDALPNGDGFLDSVRLSQKRNREFLADLGW